MGPVGHTQIFPESRIPEFLFYPLCRRCCDIPLCKTQTIHWKKESDATDARSLRVLLGMDSRLPDLSRKQHPFPVLANDGLSSCLGTALANCLLGIRLGDHKTESGSFESKYLGVLASIYSSLMLMGGIGYLYFIRQHGPTPLFGGCIDNGIFQCFGLQPWLLVLIVVWPPLAIWWFAKLLRWAARAA